MKILKDENFILNIIKFGPIFFVIIFAFFITKAIIYEKNINFEEEIKLLENSYLHSNKKRVQNEIERIYQEIEEEKKQSEILLKQMIKDRVYEAHEIATSIYNKEMNFQDSNHTHSKEHIFNTIKTTLGSIIYNKGRGYFFINDINGVNILQPLNKKIENTNILDLKDINNYPFMKNINQSIKDKTERFDSYYWYKNEEDKTPYKKISFYKYFEPFNLSIGTGEYIKDFEDEMKERLLKRIKKVRFDKTGYIFIFDSKGNALSHYDNSLIGINRLEEKDLSGRYYIKDIITYTKNSKEGFISYILRFKPNEKAEYREKISFVKYFEEWDWIIGTGFYLDNLNKQIEERKILLSNSMNNSIKHIIIISLLVTLVFIFISFYISRIITNKLIKYKKNLEKQISENIEQKETLLEAQEVAQIGAWKLEPLSNNIMYSKQIEKIFGIKDSKTNITLDYLKSTLLEEDIKKFEKFIKNCMQKDKQNHATFGILRNKTEIRWIDCRGKLDKKKNIVIGTLQDITQSKRLEIEKKNKDELLYQQSKLASMGEMLANIAHQWRQPLSEISVTATGVKLQKEMNIFDDNDLVKSMDRINNSAQYLSQTIEDFRGFFDSKNKVLKEFFVEKTIHKALNLTNSQFKLKQIQVIEDIEDFKLNSFENELIQVLMNILNNSKDALLNLENQERLIFIKTYKNNNNSYIEIYDNANGISEKILGKIFEPYFTTKHKSQGTGIGLYMSKEIVENSLEAELFAKNITFDYNKKTYKGAKFTIVF